MTLNKSSTQPWRLVGNFNSNNINDTTTATSTSYDINNSGALATASFNYNKFYNQTATGALTGINTITGAISTCNYDYNTINMLVNYYCLEELEEALKQFVHYYNYHRYHESLKNLTPADVYYGRGDAILKERERIKQMTLNRRKSRYLLQKFTPIT